MVTSRRVFLQGVMGVLPWFRTPLVMQLDWRLNAQFAGLCVAESHGEYRRRGLAVTLKAASQGIDVIKTVVNTPQTLGCAEESLILAAQAKGVAVVAIATMLQSSPLSLMSLPTIQIANLQQLKGLRVGVHSDGRKALGLVLSQHQIAPSQLEIVDIPYRDKYQRLLTGEFDAVQCYALDEPLDLAHRMGSSPNLLTFKDYGFEAYSQVIFAPASLVAEQPTTIHRFLDATFTGWRLAFAHPTQTAKLLVERYVGADYQDIDYQTQSLGIMAQYVQQGSQHLGILDPVRWQRSAQQLAQAGLIERLPPLDTSVDVSLWP